MTEAIPSSSAPEPSSSSEPSSPAAPQPRVPSRHEARFELLEAIEQRNAFLTNKLVQKWVHRRGLASLRAFQKITVQTVEGEEACRWLEALLDQPLAATAPAPGSTVERPIRVHDMLDVDALGAAHPERNHGVADEPRQQVDAAFAALAAEFSVAAADLVASAPVQTAPPPVSPALPLSTVIAAADCPPLAAPMAPPAADPDGEGDDPPGPIQHGSLPLPGLGRLKRLVRGCFAGAFDPLSVATVEPDPLPEPVQEISEEQVSKPNPQPLDEPEPWSTQAAAGQGVEAPAVELIGSPQASVKPMASFAPAEPVAPLPAFHRPGGKGSDADSIMPSSPPRPAAGHAADGRQPTMVAMPFRLPRLLDAAASQRPAPAPDALADLRAWLPDEGDDLPRAC